jgi:hypothetical protein
MGMQVMNVDTCTCPRCTPAPAAVQLPEVAGGGATLVPFAPLPPPPPPTTAYLDADWTQAPPAAGTDDQTPTLAVVNQPLVTAGLGVTNQPLTTAALAVEPDATQPQAVATNPATVATPARPQPQLQLVRVGTPFANAIGFTNPFLG